MKNVKKRVDKVRGRKRLARPEQVTLRSAHYRSVFATQGLWDKLWPRLQAAETDGEVAEAFEALKVPEIHYFVPSLCRLVLKVVRDRSFPKTPAAQIKFFADSLAGRGEVKPRRARDILAEEQAKAKAAHHIVRYEFYVECSCGYKGPSRDFGCADCGALIQVDPIYRLML